MNADQIREIFRQELAAFFASGTQPFQLKPLTGDLAVLATGGVAALKALGHARVVADSKRQKNAAA